MPEHIKDIKITKDSLKESVPSGNTSLDSLFKMYDSGVISKQAFYRERAKYRA